ncbi:hypothetical protein GcC1_079024 [Golovinomyces cichoracearum]|uniref:Uncharacterized protein n=1 Tax=Golovinomyces cichoracearum TaxID=62708 RepID=A0A420ILH2_9PEZI|nr:hypothetical protein GcC1_079024 [Golovinomyces cichoracearum]
MIMLNRDKANMMEVEALNLDLDRDFLEVQQLAFSLPVFYMRRGLNKNPIKRLPSISLELDNYGAQ